MKIIKKEDNKDYRTVTLRIEEKIMEMQERKRGLVRDLVSCDDEAIAKLKHYEKLGVDDFIYYASMGLGLKEQKRSLELFCNDVIPAFKQ